MAQLPLLWRLSAEKRLPGEELLPGRQHIFKRAAQDEYRPGEIIERPGLHPDAAIDIGERIHDAAQ